MAEHNSQGSKEHPDAGISQAIQAIVQEHLQLNQDIASDAIVNIASSEETSLFDQYAVPGAPRSLESVIEEAKHIYDYRLRMDHPRFFGFIPSPVSPISWVGEVLNSAYNTHAGSWFQSSGPSIIERSLIVWLASKAGMPSSAGGAFVSGGSMANLTAMMLARDQILNFEQRATAVAYVSDQTHSSVMKGLRVLGLANHQLRKVPTDQLFQMDVQKLADMVCEDTSLGLTPFIVVASCGTTNTGSIDPLHPIADLCAEHHLWMHVDGAYGASAVLSTSHREAVSGLGRADSISWDAHKWLFQTYGCGLFLVKEKKLLLETFANDAEYIRDAVEGEDAPNFWNYGIELTRPARAMKLWFTLRTLGESAVGEMIDHGFLLAGRAEEELRKLPHWQILSPAKMAIVTFRFVPDETEESDLDSINQRVSKRLVSSNSCGILTTKIRGHVALRICAISPKLQLDDMTAVIHKLNETAKKIVAEDVGKDY
ncbi:hypothetical protein OIDMADRAFT_35269 [Oidiodendron maius Zn]|uniref:Uncharacterized protein n=1 Tax=Oidiodendron maius (strain Zn) TaxID=913774 RepID=A0A0C3CVR4_OIDMZ|nr:hypothetical protein OIDMADRAFT_35269 [Oidiodendron maius Zn]